MRKYRAEGATPSLRYQVGFNQGVARCLQDQCTIQNLAMAASAAAFPQVRALLGIGSAANVLSAIVNPPGFDPSPDSYVKGNEEGERLCNWMLKLAVPVNSRRLPLVGPGGKVAIPKGFKFYQAVKTVRNWLPNINPSGCVRNCAISTVNTVRVFFGQPLEAAPPNPGRGWTDPEMESAMGAKFNNIPGTDVEMYKAIERMPEGTVGVIGAGAIGPESGHFFAFVKANRQVQFWDGQTGVEAMPGNWTFRWMVVGNPLNRYFRTVWQPGQGRLCRRGATRRASGGTGAAPSPGGQFQTRAVAGRRGRATAARKAPASSVAGATSSCPRCFSNWTSTSHRNNGRHPQV